MLENFSLSTPTIQQIMIAVLILVVAWLVSMLVLVTLKRTKFLTSITKSTIDDEIIRLLRRPIHLGFQFVGVVLALYYLFPTLSYKEFSYSDLIPILLILWVVYVMDRLIKGIMDWYGQESTSANADGQKRGTFGFLNTLISILVWGIGLAFILNQVGVDITALIAGLGIAGIAVALALQNTLSGLFSAVSLAVDRPVRLDDYVKLEDGTEGFIEDISMRSTRIRTFEQHTVIVPNSRLSEMIITNTYLPETSATTKVVFQVSYKTDLEHAEGVALEAANKVLEDHNAKGEEEPSVRFGDFKDSGIEMKVYLRVAKYLDQFIVRSDFVKALKLAFENEKIEMPYPQMDVHVKK